jgi:hypothetical protein
MNQEILQMVYDPYFHSVMHYDIFWGNSSYAINIFRVQKRALTIMAGIGNILL